MLFKYQDAAVRATKEFQRYLGVCAAINATYTRENLFMSPKQRAELDSALGAVKATKEWVAARGE